MDQFNEFLYKMRFYDSTAYVHVILFYVWSIVTE